MSKISYRNTPEYKAYRREYCKNYYKTKYASKQLELVRNRKKELQIWLAQIKSTLKCIRCNENDPCCIDFHHRDQSTKDFAISRGILSKGCSKERILKEIAKCVPLCSNCHRKFHDGQFQL